MSWRTKVEEQRNIYTRVLFPTSTTLPDDLVAQLPKSVTQEPPGIDEYTHTPSHQIHALGLWGVVIFLVLLLPTFWQVMSVSFYIAAWALIFTSDRVLSYSYCLDTENEQILLKVKRFGFVINRAIPFEEVYFVYTETAGGQGYMGYKIFLTTREGEQILLDWITWSSYDLEVYKAYQAAICARLATYAELFEAKALPVCVVRTYFFSPQDFPPRESISDKGEAGVFYQVNTTWGFMASICILLIVWASTLATLAETFPSEITTGIVFSFPLVIILAKPFYHMFMRITLRRW